MDFRPAHYYEAARERMTQAEAALKRREYGIAMWFAGVAVESMLRAYRTRINPAFDSRHDLSELLKQSGILAAIESDSRANGRAEIGVTNDQQVFRAEINSVNRRWHNNYRYASTGRLKAHLKAAGLSQGIKGDFLKENARELVEVARRAVDLGVRLWASSARS